MQQTMEQLDSILAGLLGLLGVLYSLLVEILYSVTVILLCIFAYITIRAIHRAVNNHLKLRRLRNEQQARKDGESSQSAR